VLFKFVVMLTAFQKGSDGLPAVTAGLDGVTSSSVQAVRHMEDATEIRMM
jgi:hypothetical protein